MWYYKTNYSKEIGFYVWLQYLFFTQWQKLKKYAGIIFKRNADNQYIISGGIFIC